MRRPAGVTVAAVVLGLMTAFGMLGSVGSLVMSVLGMNSAIPLAPGVRAMMVVSTGMLLLFCLFCAWTVVGLFRMERWARYSILVIGGLEFCFAALTGVVMILIRNSVPVPPAAGTSPASIEAVMVGMGAFYAFLSLIGLWWLVYFNLAHVRAAFAGAASAAMLRDDAVGFDQSRAAGVSGWRMVIVVWSVLMLVSSLLFPVLLFTHLPVFLFGMVIKGTAAGVVLAVLLAAQIYMGVGLLRKWKTAWFVALAWQVYAIAYFMTLLLPGMAARFAAYQQEVMSRWGATVTTPYSTPMVVPNAHAILALAMVVSVVLVAVLSVALWRRRGDYLTA